MPGIKYRKNGHARVATCPNCSPDGDSYQTRDYDGKDDVWVWRCENCHHTMPAGRRPGKPVKETRSQRQVIDWMIESFGPGTIVDRREFIGRDVWVTLKCEARKSWNGNTVFGTVGPCGAFSLTLCRPWAQDRVIRNRVEWSVWCSYEHPREG